jgi:hypothetical protein
MPAYLLRDSIAVRNGANEIEYLENALWAERLDQSFQRALMADLNGSPPSDTIHFAETDRKKEIVRIFINVQQFDVDTEGHGTLIAQWRIAASDRNESLRSGQASLARTGVFSRRDPATIASAAESRRAADDGDRDGAEQPDKHPPRFAAALTARGRAGRPAGLTSPGSAGVLDEGRKLLAEQASVRAAQVDLVVLAIEAEPHGLLCRAAVQVVLQRDGHFLSHLNLPQPRWIRPYPATLAHSAETSQITPSNWAGALRGPAGSLRRRRLPARDVRLWRRRSRCANVEEVRCRGSED